MASRKENVNGGHKHKLFLVKLSEVVMTGQRAASDDRCVGRDCRCGSWGRARGPEHHRSWGLTATSLKERIWLLLLIPTAFALHYTARESMGFTVLLLWLLMLKVGINRLLLLGLRAIGGPIVVVLGIPFKLEQRKLHLIREMHFLSSGWLRLLCLLLLYNCPFRSLTTITTPLCEKHFG